MIEKRQQIKSKKPDFIRQDAHKKKRLAKSWRRPRGSDSKMRKGLKGYRRSVRIGWGSPASAKGKSPSGLDQVLVHSSADCSSIDPKTQGIIISGSIGTKKRLDIISAAKEKNITILNIKDPDMLVKQVADKRAAAKAAKHAKKKETKKTEKVKKKETKELTDAEKKALEKKEKDKVLTKRT